LPAINSKKPEQTIGRVPTPTQQTKVVLLPFLEAGAISMMDHLTILEKKVVGGVPLITQPQGHHIWPCFIMKVKYIYGVIINPSDIQCVACGIKSFDFPAEILFEFAGRL
jgi:hypothetical protein